MRRTLILAVALLPFPSLADIFDPLEFVISQGTIAKGQTQDPNAQWTFQRGTDPGGALLIGGTNVACEQGIGNWTTLNGNYGFIPSVGPRLSPDENRDQSNSEWKPEFEGLLFLPGDANLGDAMAIFTAKEDTQLPVINLAAELVYGSSDGTRVSVKTSIGGEVVTWLDHGEIPDVQDGFQKWTLFCQDAPLLHAGDKLWIAVDSGPNHSNGGDWTNISFRSNGPDCDGSYSLDLFDFLCFVNAFNAEEPYSDCDGDGAFSLFDFLCFVNSFNVGC